MFSTHAGLVSHCYADTVVQAATVRRNAPKNVCDTPVPVAIVAVSGPDPVVTISVAVAIWALSCVTNACFVTQLCGRSSPDVLVDRAGEQAWA